MDFRDLMRILGRQRLTLVGLARVRGGIADRGIEPVSQRHAGAPRRGLGPLADGWFDALNTPRYARIHAFVRSEPGALLAPSVSPRVPFEETIEFGAGRLQSSPTFSC